MKNFDFIIRFGVHKDRETLRTLKESISGLVVPAHILCHSTDATIAAISYIKKEYYIDPMTFLYAVNIGEYLGENKKKFKPSIEKMTKDYGLLPLFEANGYSALKHTDFTEEIINDFAQKSLDLQCKKVDEKKQGAYAKYTELLKKIGENHIIDELNSLHEPKAVIPPYFFIEKNDSDWIKVNLDLANKVKSLTQKTITPIVSVSISCLNEEILNSYNDYKEFFLWVNDLDERNSTQADLKKYADFVKLGKEKGFTIRNLYGSYFSILLGKVGLSGICNGIFYGEHKGVRSKVGGVPIARYYIRKFHQFFTLPEAIPLINKYPELLDKECPEAMEIINSNPQNIIQLEKDHSKAQAHFIHCRKKEITMTEATELSEILDDMDATYKKYKNEFERHLITKKSLEYLNHWLTIFRSL